MGNNWLLLFLGCLGIVPLSSSRTLVTSVNPDCERQLNVSLCRRPYLVYVRAVGTDDVIHAYFSVRDTAACLLLRSAPSIQPVIDWSRLLSANSTGDAAITADVLAAYGFSFDQLLEYDDAGDSADIDKSNGSRVLSFGQLDLDAASVVVNGSSVTLRSPPLNQSGLGTAGVVAVKFSFADSERRSELLPHLQQTGDSALFNIALDGLVTNSNFNHSRFGVRVCSISSGSQQMSVTRRVDDEYTPGVFRLYNVAAAGDVVHSGGFLQWRPVAYTDRQFSIDHSTTVRAYNLTRRSAPPASRLLRAFFGDGTTYLPYSLVMTYGAVGDGWYRHSNYTAWSVTVGLGAPPSYHLSLMVLLLLGIGLGAPAIVLLIGGCWMLLRTRRNRRPPVPLISDDDNTEGH